MDFFKSFCVSIITIMIYEGVGWALVRLRSWYRERWCRSIGYAARDALGAGMDEAGMPTCVRPASKRGKVVNVEILGRSTRSYPIDMSSPSATIMDVRIAVAREQMGLRGE